MLRRLVLLLYAAVVLNRENDGIIRALKSIFLAGLHHVLEEDLGGESVAVVDDRLSLRSVPAVNCKY